MHSFQRHAPLDATTYVAPLEADRTGPPLTQGFLFTIVGTVAGAHCDPEVLEILAKIDPNAWYHGQLLESILSRFEDKDPALPAYVGRNVHFMARSQLDQQGIKTPSAVLEKVNAIWQRGTRGDDGEWRALVGPKRAHLEMEVSYNCRFEEGAIRGLMESFDAVDVKIEHTQCMRDGAPFCVLEVRWEEGSPPTAR